MVTTTLITPRPSTPLMPACAPSVSTSVPAPVAALAAERALVSWAHQAQIQAELALELVRGQETNGFIGFRGLSVTDGSVLVDAKRYADGGMDATSGIPPRGRPV